MPENIFSIFAADKIFQTMAASKSSIPKGTRDFLPVQAARRKYIFSTIEKVFLRYGYQPIETPSMEHLSTLLGKYGEEGDRLIFKILNSGDFARGIDGKTWETLSTGERAARICEKGLRYDLTVPFARFVVQHRHEIPFPFKRYQIQPVWRADRPQKGRYREFTQCDVDVIGSRSLLNETELLMIMDEVFRTLGIRVSIKLNHRKILSGLAEYLGMSGQFVLLTQILDKRYKIGDAKMVAQLRESGMDENALKKFSGLLGLEGDNQKILGFLGKELAQSESGSQGIAEMEELLQLADTAGVQAPCAFDFSLARGLDYYTGMIFEVIAEEWAGGSICGGGRYDDLTGIFGLHDVSGVGVSFGAERIYDVLEENNGFPELTESSTRLLFLNFGPEEVRSFLPLVPELRRKGISVEIYPDSVKIKKQMQYADQKKIPYVVLAGPEELASGKFTLRNMKTGEQQKRSPEELMDFFV